MMDIITFIRRNKKPTMAEIQSFDRSIKTKSKTLIYYELFKNHWMGLNDRRRVELLKWVNIILNSMPPTSSVEKTMTKIRKLVKDRYGYESPQYRGSLTNLVFDRVQKEKNIQDYNKKIENQTRNSREIKLKDIEKIFEENQGESFQEKLTYLLLNSGSRFVELNTGIFKDGGNGMISLSNIAKTRDKTREIKKELLDLDSEKFMKKLLEYRALNKNPDSAIIQLNSYLKDKYGFSSYTLRKYYANVSYYLQDNKKIQKNSYLSDVLGHENDDVAKIYSGYYVKE